MAPALDPSAAPEANAERAAGFTSAIRHLSLYGWLRWIHSSGSDATLRVRTENGNGTIWCSGGRIIDAEWEGRLAEEALQEMLPRSSGAVTIDFDPVARPSRVVTPTHQLLHVSEEGRERGPAVTRQALLLAESVAPVARATAHPPHPGRGWARRGGYLAGALVVAGLAVVGFVVGRERATSGLAPSSAGEQAPVAPSRPNPLPQPAPTASTPDPPIVTPKARELPTIPFVSIEVEPAHGEIWLDRELAARGALQLAAIHDGMMHELRFMAPGHETKVLFFRDAPPAGRVVLSRVTDQQVTKASATKKASPPLPRTRATPAPPAPPGKPDSDRSPRIELIEVHTPRVQVLD